MIRTLVGGERRVDLGVFILPAEQLENLLSGDLVHLSVELSGRHMEYLRAKFAEQEVLVHAYVAHAIHGVAHQTDLQRLPSPESRSRACPAAHSLAEVLAFPFFCDDMEMALRRNQGIGGVLRAMNT